jgi:4'-phosphopantetheinyl transferase
MCAILSGFKTTVRFSEAHWSALREVALDPGDVHVYAARHGGGTQSQDAATLLSSEELERARSFVRHSDQVHFVGSHAFLRRILARYVEIEPSQIQFENGPWGKPRLSGLPGVRSVEFSLSHCRGLVLVGVTVGPAIGIDVELVRQFDECDALARRFFAPREYRNLCALPEPAKSTAFFRYWTRKEAVVKALGTGMLTPLDSFDVTLATTQRMDFRAHGASASEWSLIDLEPCEGAVGAVAAPFRVERIEARLIA